MPVQNGPDFSSVPCAYSYKTVISFLPASILINVSVVRLSSIFNGRLFLKFFTFNFLIFCSSWSDSSRIVNHESLHLKASKLEVPMNPKFGFQMCHPLDGIQFSFVQISWSVWVFQAITDDLSVSAWVWHDVNSIEPNNFSVGLPLRTCRFSSWV